MHLQISDRVFLVGSGQIGFQMTHPLDCNVYLIDGGTEWALIDAGSGIAPELIVKNIEASGAPMSKVTKLLLTHIHGDHAAGARYFAENYNMEVITAEEAAPWMEAGDTEKNSIDAAKEAGVYPNDFVFPACPVAQGVVEGDEITVGSVALSVLDTPGHSRGHVSFVMEEGGEKALFGGDVIFAGGKIVLQNIWDCSIQDYAQSIGKIHALQIDRLYPGHGAFLMKNAHQCVQEAHDAFTRLSIPPNL